MLLEKSPLLSFGFDLISYLWINVYYSRLEKQKSGFQVRTAIMDLFENKIFKN